MKTKNPFLNNTDLRNDEPIPAKCTLRVTLEYESENGEFFEDTFLEEEVTYSKTSAGIKEIKDPNNPDYILKTVKTGAVNDLNLDL
jgi:hypothetical protein